MSYNSELQLNNTNLQNILDVINNLPEAENVQLPTLENPGTASDLAEGKQLIDADGNVVTGNIWVLESNKGTDLSSNPNSYPQYIESSKIFRFSDDMHHNYLCREGSTICVIKNGAVFGNATAADVAKGVTFTSENGLKISGAHECEEGVELPTLNNPGSASDLAQGKQLIGADGSVVEGTVPLYNQNYPKTEFVGWSQEDYGKALYGYYTAPNDMIVKKDAYLGVRIPLANLGNASKDQVAKGVTFTSAEGLQVEGTALIPGNDFIYPDGAFAPVTNFTDGKQYALVATINGVRRYLNNTTFNDWTMNATEIAIAEDAGDYVIFGAAPVLFTAVASGDGFLLQNGSNYLSGNSNSGSALRVDSTQAVWTVNTSESAGLEEGKYLPKEDPNAVWLFHYYSGYDWTIKFEENNNSFGFDRNGRDSNNSKGYVSFVLYEYVAGEVAANPIVDTSNGTATARDISDGKIAYVDGKEIVGTAIDINTVMSFNDDPMAISIGNQGFFDITTPNFEYDYHFYKGSKVKGYIPTSEFGDATAADVAAGKTFTSSAGLKVTGTATIGGGSTIKSGTTTSATINTGLSDIEQFFIYKETQTATGLIHLHYTKSATSRMYASAWSTSSYGTKTITNGTGGVTVSGGTLTISATQAAQGALTSGVTYKWVAIGKE